MITRFYVDNYKCLQNFEYKPQPLELILGANGSGKSTVFEALDKVRRFATGRVDAKELFDYKSRTKWSTRFIQVFEIDFLAGKSEYKYRLELDLISDNFRVEREYLSVDGKSILETDWEVIEGQKYQIEEGEGEDSFPETHSGQMRVVKREGKNSVIVSDPGKCALSAHLNLLSSVLMFKINPPSIHSRIGRATPRLNITASEFGSYYLYTLQQKQGQMFDVIAHLREVILGFDSFSVEEDFENAKRELYVNFKSNNGNRKGAPRTIKFSFDELSDGQRALIVLYTLVFCALEPKSTLIIDEPENYIALRELQPLLATIEERVEDLGAQVILISHHPEFINMLAPSQAVMFERLNNGPVRVRPFSAAEVQGLTPAEVVARGWES